jgi:formamidopyrimidine-DNA glycosylase
MTGELRTEAADFASRKHDHLVLRLPKRSLVFADPRLFGRVLFDVEADEPVWWRLLPPALDSDAFTLELVATVLRRRRAAPIKAVLLMQEFFPGVGNWMADEILWRSGIHPATGGGAIDNAGAARLFQETRAVAAAALETIAVSKDPSFGDPPPGWLFHERWDRSGKCPRCRLLLERAEIGGRTTAWCTGCQPNLKAKRIRLPGCSAGRPAR